MVRCARRLEPLAHARRLETRAPFPECTAPRQHGDAHKRGGSECGGSQPLTTMGPRWRLAVAALLGLIAPAPGSAEVALENDEKSPASLAGTVPCWQTEDFVVTQKCTPCNSFEVNIKPECRATGYIETINCSVSNKVKDKSCRSAEMEAHIFWRFEGAMLSVALVFALMVVCRQRMLDRKAREKVRKQIESI